ncbi:MAG: hypothetical protein MI867_24665, partial [Pseudomonadales bacterium]|nr:hypothetical protein [Pseudomonadales bacterium]
MDSLRKVLKAIIAVLICALLIVIIVAMYFGNKLNERCEEIGSIASDEKAVLFLDEWANEKVLNNGYYLVSGMHGRIVAHSLDDST